MKKRMIVAANWKMNKNLSEASEFLEKLDFHLHENNNQSSVIIFKFFGIASVGQVGIHKLHATHSSVIKAFRT